MRWAATFGQLLSGMEEASKDALWKRWLDRYWRDRVEGIPVQVTESEGGDDRVEYFSQDRVSEVVDRILRTPIPDLNGSFILTELNDSDPPQRHPEATASLVLHVLQNTNSLPWDTRGIHPLVRKLAASEETKATVRQICDELARLGDTTAAELRKLAD